MNERCCDHRRKGAVAPKGDHDAGSAAAALCGSAVRRKQRAQLGSARYLCSFFLFLFLYLRVIVICAPLLFARHGESSHGSRGAGTSRASGHRGGRSKRPKKTRPGCSERRSEIKSSPRFENKQSGRERKTYKETHSAYEVVPKTASPVGSVSFLVFRFLHSLFSLSLSRTTFSFSLFSLVGQ